MDINEVIKLAIRDAELRKCLMAHPVETCRKLGLEMVKLPLNINFLQTPMTSSVMQGGYRP